MERFILKFPQLVTVLLSRADFKTESIRLLPACLITHLAHGWHAVMSEISGRAWRAIEKM